MLLALALLGQRLQHAFHLLGVASVLGIEVQRPPGVDEPFHEVAVSHRAHAPVEGGLRDSLVVEDGEDRLRFFEPVLLQKAAGEGEAGGGITLFDRRGIVAPEAG